MTVPVALKRFKDAVLHAIRYNAYLTIYEILYMSNKEGLITKVQFCKDCQALDKFGNCTKAIEPISRGKIVEYGLCAMGTDQNGVSVTRRVTRGKLYLSGQIKDN